MNTLTDSAIPPTIIAPKPKAKKFVWRLIPLFILIAGLAVGLIALRIRLSTKPKAAETIAKIWFGTGAFGPASVTTAGTEFTVRITISVPDGQKIGFARTMLQLPASVSVAFDAATIPIQYELVSDGATQLDGTATLVVRIKPDSTDAATQVLSVNAVVTLPSAGFTGDIRLFNPQNATEVYSQAVGLDPAQNYVNEAINSSDSTAGVLQINPADLSPTPTPTPPACGKDLYCDFSSPPAGSAPCIRPTTGNIIYCCPSGQTIIDGYCSGSITPTSTPPSCVSVIGEDCTYADCCDGLICDTQRNTCQAGALTLTPTPIPTVSETSASASFTVHLQGAAAGARNQTVSMQLKQGDTLVKEYTDILVTSGTNRSYTGTFTDFAPGTYDVFLEGRSHLRKKVASGVSLAASGTYNWADTTHELRAGDVNGDNKITLVDITGISSARGDQLIVPITDAITEYDVNGDSSITVQDLALAIMNWANYADENMEVVGD